MVVQELVAANATLSACKIVLESTSEWSSLKPRFLQVQAFKQMIDSNAVLGFTPSLLREKYALTPIIKSFENCDDAGAVSVAMVPASMGKTTAAKFFLHKNKEQVRGIAICRTEKGTPYVMSMLQLLGLDTTNPPNGWLTCLIEALSSPSRRKTFLILDEYVGRTGDEADEAFITTLKSHLRNTSVFAIALTPNEEYADWLLSLNQLQGIVPLNGTYLERRYPDGKWKDMHWPVVTLKTAARQDPLLISHIGRINDAIDNYVQGLTEEEFRQLSILKILKMLRERLLPPGEALTQSSLDLQVSTSAEDKDSTFCSACRIS